MSDDETAVLMAAAGAALAHLQVMRAAYSLLLDEDLDLDADPDAAATGRKRAGPLLSWEEELLLEGNDFEAEEGEDPRPAKHTRTSYPRPAYSASVWGVMLEGMRVLHAAGQLRPACTQAVEFRRRFRVPYEFFLWLVETVKPWFANVTQDVARRECVPVTLKVLGVLYALGSCGNCFADIAQNSLMSRQTAEKSVHAFCKQLSAKLYDTWVHLPKGDDLVAVEKKFRERGFPGAVGSTDCTHMARGRCSPLDARAHTGEEGFPLRRYSVTVDLDGRIMASTKGDPGELSVKNVVRRDASVMRVRYESPWSTIKFSLCGEDGEEVEHTGGWLVADGECDRWKLLMCPMKAPSTVDELNWSERLERVREDAERPFAIIRGRFRLLKTKVTYHNPERVDSVWLTCCILHNMLLKFDGLDALEEGIDWAGLDGAPEAGTDWTGADAIPEIGTILALPGANLGDDGEEENEEEEGEERAAEAVAEIDPGFEGFRSKLVKHLAYQLNRGEV